MDTTTAPAQADGVQSSTDSFEPGSEEAFQSLLDNDLTDSRIATRQPEDAEQTQEPPQETAPKEKPEEPTEEQKAYDSLDQYLTEAKLEPESFMALPVKVKVDGVEQSVPLAEIVKGYQLSSASYSRMNELAQQRTAFQAEQSQVRQALQQQIQNTETMFTLAKNQLLGDFNRIDWNSLRIQNPAEYAALAQDFNTRNAAIEQQLQQINGAKQVEAQKAEQARQQALPGERQKLIAARPEWADPAKFSAARELIVNYARKEGYSDAELNITDHRLLLTLDKAAQWDKLQASAPATVARVRTAPKMAKPGTRQVADPKASAYQQASERFAASGGRDDDAGARVFEAF